MYGCSYVTLLGVCVYFSCLSGLVFNFQTVGKFLFIFFRSCDSIILYQQSEHLFSDVCKVVNFIQKFDITKHNCNINGICVVLGSWFISDLCSAMQQIGHCQPLRVVLQRTRRNLNSRVDCLGNRYVMQINEDITTLLK